MVLGLPHYGKKIKRVRELQGIKQEVLGRKLKLTRQAISKMENTADIDEDKLHQVAKALNVTPEIIRNFSEEGVINNISCTFSDNAVNTQYYNYQIEKFAEIVEENKQLYERMLETERSKVKLLEDLLKEKGK